MLEIIKIKFGGMLNRIVACFHRVDDGPETVIATICGSIDRDIDRLGEAVDALSERFEDNLTLIKEIDVENEAIQNQTERAYKLRTGLNKLLGGE